MPNLDHSHDIDREECYEVLRNGYMLWTKQVSYHRLYIDDSIFYDQKAQHKQ